MLDVDGLRSASRILALASWAVCLRPADAHGEGTPRQAGSPRVAKEEAAAEVLVRRRVEDLARAVRAKDIERVIAFDAPTIVPFDIGPPLRRVGQSAAP